jgi:hypothetical protein
MVAKTCKQIKKLRTTRLQRTGYNGGWPSARLFGWSAADWSRPATNESISSERKRKSLVLCQRGLTDRAKQKGVVKMWIEHGRHDWQAPKFTQYEKWILALSIGVKSGACQSWRVCLICCGVQAICYHKLLIPTHPLHQYRIFLMMYNSYWKRISLQQKWKKTAEWLVFYEDLSHFPMEITTLGLNCTMCA